MDGSIYNSITSCSNLNCQLTYLVIEKNIDNRIPTARAKINKCHDTDSPPRDYLYASYIYIYKNLIARYSLSFKNRNTFLPKVVRV